MTPNQLRILCHVVNLAVVAMPTDTTAGKWLAHLLPFAGMAITEWLHAKHKAKPVPHHNHKKRK